MQFSETGNRLSTMSYFAPKYILDDLFHNHVLTMSKSGFESNKVFFLVIWIQGAAVQPTLVIVYFGGNDATNPHPSGKGAHVPLPEYVENMRKIALHLKVTLVFILVFLMSCYKCILYKLSYDKENDLLLGSTTGLQIYRNMAIISLTNQYNYKAELGLNL